MFDELEKKEDTISIEPNIEGEPENKNRLIFIIVSVVFLIIVLLSAFAYFKKVVNDKMSLDSVGDSFKMSDEVNDGEMNITREWVDKEDVLKKIEEKKQQNQNNLLKINNQDIIDDINSIRNALELYFIDYNKYPSEEEYNNGLGLVETGYMVDIPIDPSTEKPFYYYPDANFLYYKIEYEIGSTTDGVDIGSHFACPDSVKCDDYSKNNADELETHTDPNLDSDGDGLNDIDEEIYGTDINNADTDGDGYSDGDEVNNGYNPSGEGNLSENDKYGLAENILSILETQESLKKIAEPFLRVETQDIGDKITISYTDWNENSFVVIKKPDSSGESELMAVSDLLNAGKNENIEIFLKTTVSGVVLDAYLFKDDGDGLFNEKSDLNVIDPRNGSILTQSFDVRTR